jgi:hypothetical protein
MKKTFAPLFIAATLLCPAISQAARQTRYTEPLAANLTEAQRSAAQAIAEFTGDRADTFEKSVLIGQISRQRLLNQETADEIIRLLNARDYNQNGFDDQPIMLALIEANLAGENLRRVSQVLRNRPSNGQAYAAIAREYAAFVLQIPQPQSVSAEDRSRRNALIESLVTRIDNRSNDALAREAAAGRNSGVFMQMQAIARQAGISSSQATLLESLVTSTGMMTSSYFSPSLITRISQSRLTEEEASRLVSIVNQTEPRMQFRVWQNIFNLVLQNRDYLSLPTPILRAALQTSSFEFEFSSSRNPLPALLSAYREGPLSPALQAIIDALLSNQAAFRENNFLGALNAVARVRRDFSEGEELAFIALAKHANAGQFFRAGFYSNHGFAIELLEWRARGRNLSPENAAFLTTLLASPDFAFLRHNSTVYYLVTTKNVDASVAERIVAMARSSQSFAEPEREVLVSFMTNALGSRQVSAEEERVLFETAKRALSLRNLGSEERRILLGRIRPEYGPAHIAFVNAVMPRIEADPTALRRFFGYGPQRARTEAEYRLVLQAEDVLQSLAVRRNTLRPELDYANAMARILEHASPLSPPQLRLVSAILSLNPENSHRNGIDENRALFAILRQSSLTEAQAEVLMEIFRNTELFGQPMFRPTEALLLTLERTPSPSPQQVVALREIVRRENGACMLRFRTQKESLYAAVAQGQDFATENQNLLSQSNAHADCQNLVGALRPLMTSAAQ